VSDCNKGGGKMIEAQKKMEQQAAGVGAWQ
jgi:hypothetical protein